MKSIFKSKRLICLILSILMCLSMLISCNKENAENNTAATESSINSTKETEELASEQVTTSDSTNQETTAEDITTEETTTEETTTEETTTKEPELLNSLSFSIVPENTTLSKYFTNPNQCAVSLENDGDEGQVLKITTKSINGAGTSDPYIYFRHTKLVEDLGYIPVDTRDYPYLVLKIRRCGMTGGTFSLYGYDSYPPSGTGVTSQIDINMQYNEDWQYLWIDLSSYNKDLSVIRFDMENMALANGETLYISQMTFYSDKEESLAFKPQNTYPISEKTNENYTARVMSFNVQTENGTQVRADIRADMLRALIDEYQPDSIGMQEVTTLWRSMMDSSVFNDSYSSVGEPRSAGGEANPIYYRSDKFELVDSGTFWLSDTPDVVGSMYENCNYPRICTWAHLRDKVTGKEYVHLNTHLDHNGDNTAKEGRSLRMKQFTVILLFMQRFENIPMVLTGDLNQAAVNSDNEKYAVYKTMIGERAFELEDGSKAYSPFSNARYDAADNMPEGICASMTTYYAEGTSKYNPAKEPIDYVLYTDESLTALSYKLRLYDRGGLYLSDHLPVITDIQFK